jgi:hypothetical protein
MGALASLRGVEMERISGESRFVSTRLAMLREACSDGIIRLEKVDTEDMVADIFTKPLAGKRLKKIRALVLGHAYLEEARADGGN